MTEWANRSEFHEVAEAVGVPTDHIIGAQDGALLVTWSTDVEDMDAAVMMGVIARHPADGVPHLLRQWQISTLGEWMESMRQSIDEIMESDD